LKEFIQLFTENVSSGLIETFGVMPNNIFRKGIIIDIEKTEKTIDNTLNNILSNEKAKYFFK
jgi:hypothetical protein